MSKVLEAIKQRRSVRKFLTRPVPDKIVYEVLEAAGFAPSAHNSQPWRFIFLSETKLKRELALAVVDSWAVDLAKDGLAVNEQTRKERYERYANAPVLLLACLTMDGLRKFNDSDRQSFERDLAVQSLGASLQTLLLVAHEAGLGACWFSAPGFCKPTIRKVLEIPREVEPQAFIMMGYADEKPPVPNKKKVDQYCFMNRWGENLRI
jgi:coenzyme F420-0:L-glutamate ligase/coenzyme F420-1:gamma-L-glutamate ligase